VEWKSWSHHFYAASSARWEGKHPLLFSYKSEESRSSTRKMSSENNLFGFCQTHVLFLHPKWFSFFVADICFLCFVYFLCFVGVICVCWWWCVDDVALMMKGGIDFGRNLDCEEARWYWWCCRVDWFE
jgi:hypothetical protein